MKSIKLTTLLAAFAAAFITTSHAETKTWDGGANTTAWGDANNWNPDGVPVQADSVEIDGVSVTHNGNLVVSSVKLTGGATVTASGELKSEGDAVNPVYNGGVVSCTLLALITGPVTISDAEIRNSGTREKNGIYQAGDNYLNFVDGDHRGAAYTFNATLGSNPYSLFVDRQVPLIRYKDKAMSKTVFDDNFDYTNNEDGTITLFMKPNTGWHVGSPAVENVATVSEGIKSATVSAVATKVVESAPNAPDCYVAFDTEDHGSDFASWPTATRVAATLSDGVISASIEFNSGVTYYARVFASYTMGDVTEIASSSAVEFKSLDVDYGGLTNVYEYIGTDNDLSKVANWMLDGSFATSVPTAGTDIRWFGNGSSYETTARPRFYSSDYFVGTDIYIHGDCDTAQDITLSNSTFKTSLLVLDGSSASQTISLYGSDFISFRSDNGDYGFWNYGNLLKVNFIGGAKSSWTCRANGKDTKEKIYTAIFDTEKFTFNGAKVDSETWDSSFFVEEVSVDGVSGFVTITYDPNPSAYSISSVSVVPFDTAATFTAKLLLVSENTGAQLNFACVEGSEEPGDAAVLADSEPVVAVANMTDERSVSGLTKGATYSYRFAIVVNGEIKASMGGSFVAKEYDAVYRNGQWEDGVSLPLNNAANHILIASDYDAGEAELASPKKVVENAKLTMATLINGNGPTLLHNGWIVATRSGDLAVAPYSIYPTDPGKKFLDLVHDTPADGVVYRASCYSFRYESEGWTRPTDEAMFSYLFDGGRVLVNGESLTSAQASALIAVSDDTVNSRVYLHTVDDASLIAGSGAWTFQPGARIKLSKKEHIASVSIPDATDVSINLNGNTLRIGNLTVGGEKVSGTFTSADLSYLSGSGKLIAGGNGLAIIIR